MENNKEKQERIYTGDKDGVNVFADVEKNRYIIELPNSYDVYWGLTGKVRDEQFAFRLDSNDKSIVAFEVPLDNLSSQDRVKTFNIKVNEARKINREISTEKKDFEDILSFDQMKEGKPVAFIYKNPAKGFCVSEVLKTGKYFVALTGGESDDKVFVRIIHTNRLLNGKEEYSNREESIQSKFPVGDVKYIRFDEHGKITVRDYQAKAKVEQIAVVDNVESIDSKNTVKETDVIEPVVVETEEVQEVSNVSEANAESIAKELSTKLAKPTKKTTKSRAIKK